VTGSYCSSQAKSSDVGSFQYPKVRVKTLIAIHPVSGVNGRKIR
jgi:hypothetical protein